MLYPLILGLAGVVSSLAVMWSLSGNSESDLAMGPIVQMETLDEDGNISVDPVLVLPGIVSTRLEETEDIIDFAFEHPVVLRFVARRVDTDTFRTGARLKVWVELVKDGKAKEFFPYEFDMRADAENSVLKQATYTLLRGPRDDHGSESWHWEACVGVTKVPISSS